MTKKILIIAMLAILPLGLAAQGNGSNSSYSRYGLGTLDNQSQSFNRGMGGVALGLRSGQHINMINPASYSAIDSLSFLFDLGLTLQYGHMSDKSNSVNVRNTSFSNVNAGFRVAKGLGMSFGFVPFSSIGYNFKGEGRVGNGAATSQPITTKTTYVGEGGLHQIYLGAGWNPLADLSIGANVSYLWGDYEHSMAQSFYEGSTVSSGYNAQHNTYEASLSSYKIDFGLQYPIKINKDNTLTIGATYSLGHTINNDATLNRYTSANDTVSRTAKNAFSLPHTFGGGVSWTHGDKWIVAADVLHEMWDGCRLPVAETTSTDIAYNVRTDQFMNRTCVKLGLEYTPNAADRSKYLQTIKYRLGANYTTPYTKVNGHDGPTEFHLTAGVGLPLQTRKMSGRSLINVSAEWMRRKASTAGLISENYLMLNVGLTFNERWFMKWKIE